MLPAPSPAGSLAQSEKLVLGYPSDDRVHVQRRRHVREADPGLTRAQVLTLLLCSCLSVLGAVLLAPALPTIQEAYPSLRQAEIVAVLVLTAPALMIGLTGAPMGRLVDRIGSKQLLLWALVGYAVAGTAPLWLASLWSILGSRALLGVAEAAIATCSTTLLAQGAQGRRWDRYFGLQTVFTTVAATVFVAVGGLLTDRDWRLLFWLYAVSLPLAVLAAVCLREPARGDRDRFVPVRWTRLGAPITITAAGGVVFYVLIVQLPYVLGTVGVVSPASIGLISAGCSLVTAISGYAFGWIGRLGPIVAVPASFCLSGIGLTGLAFAGTPTIAVVCAAVTGAGNGLLLPAVLTWTLSALQAEHRARGIGVWTAALFAGQFACPLVLRAFPERVAAFSPALLVIGGASLLIGLLALVIAPDPSDRAAG